MFSERKITIQKNNKKIYIILIQIYLIEMKLFIIKYDKKLDTNKWSINDTC